MLFSLNVIVVIGAVGLSVDFGTWASQRTDLVGAADAGSIAGARELANALLERDDANAVSRAKAVALKYVKENGGKAATPQIVVSTAQPPSVTVVLAELGTQHFSKAVGQKQPTINVRSVASGEQVANACIVALSPTANPGIEYNLSGDVIANGCSIWSNSTTSNSTQGKGSGTVVADTNCSVGTANINGGLALIPKARSNCLPVVDPMADWSPPPTPWSCKDNNLLIEKPGTYSLEPGKYCGGITIKGQAKVTFQPGIYFIKGGELAVEGGGEIYGTGVTFIFTGGGSANLAGASVVELSAPTSGNTAGMVLASGRDEPAMTSILRGSNDFKVEGHVYLPTHHLVWTGGPSGNFPAAYTTVIAATVRFDGSSRVEFRTNSGSGPDYGARAFTHVHLTE
jgi:Flp pilus assembly protein TadG